MILLQDFNINFVEEELHALLRLMYQLNYSMESDISSMGDNLYNDIITVIYNKPGCC